MPPYLRIDDFGDISVNMDVESIPDPQEAYNEIIDILRYDCNIGKDDITEKQYQHEKDGDTEKIFSEIRAYEPKDKYTHVYVKIKIFIEMTPAKHEDYDYVGDLEVNGTARVRTHYPQDNWLQQSMLWHAFRTFYEKMIYSDIKQVFIEDCNKYMRRVRDGLKSYFDMLPTIQ